MILIQQKRNKISYEFISFDFFDAAEIEVLTKDSELQREEETLLGRRDGRDEDR